MMHFPRNRQVTQVNMRLETAGVHTHTHTQEGISGHAQKKCTCAHIQTHKVAL